MSVTHVYMSHASLAVTFMMILVTLQLTVSACESLDHSSSTIVSILLQYQTPTWLLQVMMLLWVLRDFHTNLTHRNSSQAGHSTCTESITALGEDWAESYLCSGRVVGEADSQPCSCIVIVVRTRYNRSPEMVVEWVIMKGHHSTHHGSWTWRLDCTVYHVNVTLFCIGGMFSLTHWGRVTQICVFTLQLRKTDDANLRF